ncbi:MAG: hypothetical protein ACI4I9_09500 [Porcipelethomonas sp.]
MSSIKETAEKYREEMMRLYGSRISSADKQEANETSGEKPPQRESLESNEEKPPETENILQDSIESRYPPPEIPDFIRGSAEIPESSTEYAGPIMEDTAKITVHEPASQPVPLRQISPLPEADAYGYLKVQVRTGDGGIPVPNAAVTVSRMIDGKEVIYRLSTTDINGETEVIKLPTIKMTRNPTVPADYEQSIKYDVSVYIKDFFREISTNVPIFENISSVQTFNLIPQPFAFEQNDTLIFRNTEPEI